MESRFAGGSLGAPGAGAPGPSRPDGCWRRRTRASRPLDDAGEQATRDAGGRASEREGGLGRGDVVDRYVILTALGQGGMGVVFAAYDPELDRKVALKLLLPAAAQSDGHGDGRTRLLREAQALAQLSHPAVVAVHDVGTVGDQVWLAMEFVDGVTLARWIKQRGRGARCSSVFRRAGEGLAAAHAAGLVHRDFKPENVMVGADGRVRVMDFGLARADGPSPLPPRSDLRVSSSALRAEVTARGRCSGRRRTWPRSSGSAGRPTRAPISSRSAWRCGRRCTGCGRSPARRTRRWPTA
jgi:serine/threonine protein kinase